MAGYNFPMADFTPQLAGYTGQGGFRFWCQKVLPIVYDDSLSYYELLCKVVVYLNNVIKDVATAEDNIGELLKAYEFLQEFVNEQGEILTERVNEAIAYIDEYFNNLVIEIGTRVGGNLISPLYVGDYLSDGTHQPACCLKIGDNYYTFNALTNNEAIAAGNNYGYLRKFILNENENYEDTAAKKQLLLGHANSVAFDKANAVVYIAPVWNYENSVTTGEREDAYYLYKYSYPEFNFLGKLDTPSVAMGISFDPVSEKLWYLDYDNKLYRYDTSWVEFSTVDYSNVELPPFDPGKKYNQDLAIYDSNLFISSPFRSVLHGVVTPENTVINDNITLLAADSWLHFKLGENEGMEFDAEGHLIYIDYTVLVGPIYNAFVCELPVGIAPSIISGLSGGVYSVANHTLTLSAETQQKFNLKISDIRSLAQISAIPFMTEVNQVNIPATVVINGVETPNRVVEPSYIWIVKPIQLTIGGTYELDYMVVAGGGLRIYASNANATIIFRDEHVFFSVQRNGDITLGGGYPLHVQTPNCNDEQIKLIGTSAVTPLFTLDKRPINDLDNRRFYVNNVPILNYGLNAGGTNLEIYSPSGTLPIGQYSCHTGFLSGDGKSIYITVPMAKHLPSYTDITAVSGNLHVRGISGLVFDVANNNSFFDVTDARYIFYCSVVNLNFLRIRITKADGTIFNEVNKGLVVCCEVQDTFTVALNIRPQT